MMNTNRYICFCKRTPHLDLLSSTTAKHWQEINHFADFLSDVFEYQH